MENKNFLMPPKIHPAVVAVWAALVATAHLLPTVPLIGVGGGNFSFASALYPLSGILFGPVAGALCTAVGGFLGTVIAPHTKNMLGLGSFIIWTTTAFTAGCIAWSSWPPITINTKGNFIINGGIIVYLVGTLLWFSQEIGRSFIWTPVIYYGAGFTALIIGCIFAGKVLSGENKLLNKLLKIPVLWLCAFGGMIGGATIGNFFALVLYQTPKETWFGLLPVSLSERALFSIGTVLIGAPLIIGLRKIGLLVGPQQDENIPLPPPPPQQPQNG
jgi:hypothetical protein